MKGDSSPERLVKYIFYGIFGLIFAWVPVCVAVVRSFREGHKFMTALKWEWESWMLSIEQALK